jgi:hypothetical protein
VRQHRPRRRLRLRAGAGLVGPACCAVSSAMRLRATIPRGSWRRGMHAPQKCMHPHAHARHAVWCVQKCSEAGNCISFGLTDEFGARNLGGCSESAVSEYSPG